MITWDEPKRLENFRKHGLDFAGCEVVFDHPVFTQEDARDSYSEPRMNLIGWLHMGNGFISPIPSVAKCCA
jgi:uncharacterized DUF497 family protein